MSRKEGNYNRYMGKIRDGVNVGGRPDKLTPQTQAIIVEALEKHNYISTACALAGISEATFYNWLDKAESYQTRLLGKEEGIKEEIEEEGGKYIRFFEEVKRTQAGSESGLLGRIDTAGSVATLIEERTITHKLKDGTEKVEVLQRWKPADWTANAWILERTRWEKYGQHSSLDIQQAGVVFIERLQKARTAKVIEGEFKAIEEIAKEPIVEEVPGGSALNLIAKPLGEATKTPQKYSSEQPKRRPIFELIAKTKTKAANEPEPGGGAATNSEGGDN